MVSITYSHLGYSYKDGYSRHKVIMPRYGRRSRARSRRPRRRGGRRRGRVIRRKAIRGIANAVRVPNLTVLNGMKPRPVSVVETERFAAAINYANYSVNFYNWMTFDPSGNPAYSSGILNLTTAAGAPAQQYAQMPSFSTYANLYDFYKVKKIVLMFRVVQVANTNLTNNTLEMYWRHDYDPTSNPLDITWIDKYAKTKHFRFTPEHPEVRVVLYPRVAANLQAFNPGGGVVAQASRIMKMPWTDVTAPVTLLGLRVLVPQMTSNLSLQVDVTYHTLFKFRQ